MNFTEKYKSVYQYWIKDQYQELTKKELVKILEEYADAFENETPIYLRPSGDDWDYKDEYSKFWKLVTNRNLKQVNYLYRVTNSEARKTATNLKKSILIDILLTCDLAFSSMNNIKGRHPYADITVSNIDKYCRWTFLG